MYHIMSCVLNSLDEDDIRHLLLELVSTNDEILDERVMRASERVLASKSGNRFPFAKYLEMRRYCQQGRKVPAIKIWRSLTGDGLRDAKEGIEEMFKAELAAAPSWQQQ